MVPAIASAACFRTATSDFDGSCQSDVLWRNTGSSQIDVWLMNGTTISNSGSPGTPGPDWSVIGVGDFNGDGMADMLWQNSETGELVIWFMNGATITSSGSPGYPPSSDWNVQGVGDFNGDGIADILWQSASTGEVVIWFMSGCSIAGSLDLGAVPGWNVVGVGDFDGDGNTDIFWQNQATATNVVWLMSSSGIVSSGSPGSPGTPWQVQGVGDFDGDGKSDILWQNTATGQLVVWLMSGTSIGSSGSPGSPSITSTPWSVQQVGDFDGDGKSDILFYNNQTSEVVIWLMNGASIATSGSLGTPGLYWQVQTPPPYGVPAPAKAVGYSDRTFDSITLANSAGQLYFPTGFFVPGFGTITANSDNSFTMTNGKNLPMVSSAHYDKTKPNKWGGECFAGGGFYDVYASWTPFVGTGQPSWPQIALYDVDATGNNAVGPWNAWSDQSITATASPTTGATTIAIPAWTGSSQAAVSNLTITSATGQFSGTFSGLYVGATITMSGTPGGSASIGGYTSPTTYYVSAVNASTQTFTLQTMGLAALTTTAGTLTGLTYTPGYSGTVTFSDSETRLAWFTAGITNISWVQPLVGSSFTTALSVNWGSNFVHTPEFDIVEADQPVATTLGIDAFFDWYAAIGSQNKVHTKFTPSTGIDTSTPHHYSVLWVPATANAQGYAKWYFDGALLNTAMWNQYDPNSPPAATGTEVSPHLWQGGSAFSVVDTRCMIPVMSTAQGTAAPMTIYSVSVWQASPSNNQTQ